MHIRSMRRFSELNQLRVGIAGIVAVALLVGLALNAGRIRTAVGGERQSAAFSEAGGIAKNDDVRIAGVTVGSVTGVSLDGTWVKVDFTVDGVRLGDRTAAAIKTDSALGRKFLELRPAGNTQLDQQIPLSRTRSPYDVTTALSDLTATTEAIDTDQLARSFDVLAQTFADTPSALRATMRGVSRLSRTIASRDTELRGLFARANSVTGVLSQRNLQITRLLVDGSALFAELDARRRVIHELLVNITEATHQLTALARENRSSLRPALDELREVTAVLNKNKKNLEAVVTTFGGYARSLGEAVGGGPFFYAYVENLVPSNLAPVLPELFGKAGER